MTPREQSEHLQQKANDLAVDRRVQLSKTLSSLARKIRTDPLGPKARHATSGLSQALVSAGPVTARRASTGEALTSGMTAATCGFHVNGQG